MAQTTSVALDPIVPEVWEDVLEEKLPFKIKFAPLATINTELEGQPGDTIKMSWWDYIGDAEDIAETAVIVPTAMSADGESMTIKEAAKGVELTDKARLTALGDPEGAAQRQLLKSVSQKIDKDIFAAVAATGAGSVNVMSTGGTPTQMPFSIDNLAAGIAVFGDVDEGEWEDAFAALVISPEEQIDVVTDARFLTRDKAGDVATLFNGAIGALYGSIPVVVSARARTTGARLVRKDSTLLAYKRRPMVETDRDILARSTIITTNVHYGVYRRTRETVVAAFAPQA